MATFKIDENFQTPPVVAEYMANMVMNTHYRVEAIRNHGITIIEPTPGLGVLYLALTKVAKILMPAGDFWRSELINTHADFFVMNPPFNPVNEMELFVNHALGHSENVIALLPWTYIINSERRMREITAYGLVSVTHLPRKTFPGCRVQVAIFELKKGYTGPTELKKFSW